MKRYIAAMRNVMMMGLIMFGAAAAQVPAQPDIDSLLHHIDELYRSNASYSELEMEITTPHWQRTLAMKAWTEGLKKTFIRITSPEKEKGVATLRIGSEMWNYLPKTNKVIKIPPSMMMSSWMGSDFTNDDLVKEFSLFEDYTYEQIYPDSGKTDTIYVNCIPHPDLPVVWGNIIVAVRARDSIPIWQKYYDEQGKLMRVLEYSDVKTFDGRVIPATMTMIPQEKEGHKTVIRYLTINFNPNLDEDIFSLRNLYSTH